MNKWKRYIPVGGQDYLKDECYNKLLIQDKLRKLFSLSGYDEVETPLLEYLDVFTGIKASIEHEQMFKLFDNDGRILALRPDITIPIARMVATKLRSSVLPIRLSYIGNVYRNQKMQTGKQSEIAQAGIELIGAEGPEADAEIIAIAVQSFLDLGIHDFQIDIGQVEFFKGLINLAEMGEEWEEDVRSLIEQKNMLELELVLKNSKIPDNLKNLIYNLPQQYGNDDMLKIASKLTNNPKCDKAITNLWDVYNILKELGFVKYVTFDLGMVQSFNFYTGIVFRGITHKLGYPICGGGRYDKLVNEFGYDVPATGFAIGIKRALMVLERQNCLFAKPGIDILVVYDTSCRLKASSITKALRNEGYRVVSFISTSGCSDFKLYAQAHKIPKLVHVCENEIYEYLFDKEEK